MPRRTPPRPLRALPAGRRLRRPAGLLLALLLPAAARAETPMGAPPPPRNHLGVSVMGVAGFLRHNLGSFEVFYERVLGRHHGLRLAGDFLHVHHNSPEVQSHQWTFGGTLAYRYYAGEGRGPFAGLKLGYRRGYGHFGDHAAPDHAHLQNEQLLILPQGGYRLLLPRAPLAVVAALGLGYARTSVWATNRDDEAGRAAARASQDNLQTTPLAMDLELSLAYAF